METTGYSKTLPTSNVYIKLIPDTLATGNAGPAAEKSEQQVKFEEIFGLVIRKGGMSSRALRL